MSLIRNERLKLLTTFLNGIAIAMFAVGGIAPVFSILSEGSLFTPVAVWSTILCFCGAVARHCLAQAVLGSLR